MISVKLVRKKLAIMFDPVPKPQASLISWLKNTTRSRKLRFIEA